MPVILRRLLGFIVLVATIGLATCQSLVKAEPLNSTYTTETFPASHAQPQQ